MPHNANINIQIYEAILAPRGESGVSCSCPLLFYPGRGVRGAGVVNNSRHPFFCKFGNEPPYLSYLFPAYYLIICAKGGREIFQRKRGKRYNTASGTY